MIYIERERVVTNIYGLIYVYNIEVVKPQQSQQPRFCAYLLNTHTHKKYSHECPPNLHKHAISVSVLVLNSNSPSPSTFCRCVLYDTPTKLNSIQLQRAIVAAERRMSHLYNLNVCEIIRTNNFYCAGIAAAAAAAATAAAIGAAVAAAFAADFLWPSAS